MNFYSYSVVGIFITIIMLLFGVMLFFFTPTRNSWYGYRTKTTLKSSSIWKYANKLLGLNWFVFGIVQTLIFIVLVIVSQVSEIKPAIGILFDAICTIIFTGTLIVSEVLVYRKAQKIEK